jgi:thioredoxin-like negative regulator of GroEL
MNNKIIPDHSIGDVNKDRSFLDRMGRTLDRILRLEELDFDFKPYQPKHMIEITDDNFIELAVDPEKPFILMFKSQICPHCISFLPKLDAYAGKVSDQLTIGHVEFNQNLNLVHHFKVESIPTLLFFENRELRHFKTFFGSDQDRFEGEIPIKALKKIVRKVFVS